MYRERRKYDVKLKYENFSFEKRHYHCHRHRYCTLYRYITRTHHMYRYIIVLYIRIHVKGDVLVAYG